MVASRDTYLHLSITSDPSTVFVSILANPGKASFPKRSHLYHQMKHSSIIYVSKTDVSPNLDRIHVQILHSLSSNCTSIQCAETSHLFISVYAVENKGRGREKVQRQDCTPSKISRLF